MAEDDMDYRAKKGTPLLKSRPCEDEGAHKILPPPNASPTFMRHPHHQKKEPAISESHAAPPDTIGGDLPVYLLGMRFYKNMVMNGAAEQRVLATIFQQQQGIRNEEWVPELKGW